MKELGPIGGVCQKILYVDPPMPMVLQLHCGPPGSILGPSFLNDRFRALKPSGFERELNIKKSHVIFGDPSQATPKGIALPSKCLLQKTESKHFLYLVTKY